MPPSFLGLPPEIRNEIYKFLLVSAEPIDFWNNSHGIHPNILYTNTKILHEARAILYGQNRFDIIASFGNWSFHSSIPEFIDEIGHVNASYVGQIRVSFPKLCCEGNVSIENENLPTFEMLLSCFTNLRTVVTTLQYSDVMENTLNLLNSPTTCDNAVTLVDTHFRAIPSLREIAVEVYEDHSSSHLRRKMESCGWRIILMQKVEEPVPARSYAFVLPSMRDLDW